MKRALGGATLALVTAGLMYSYIVTQRERSYRDFVEKGDAALARDDSYEAIEAFSVAISLKTDSVPAHIKRGEAYRRRQEYESAARDLRRAAQIDPFSPYVRELLGDVSYALAERDPYFARVNYTRAITHYRASLGLDDRSARVQYKLGLAAFRSDQLEVAIEALQEAIRLDGRFAEAHYLLGVCLSTVSRPREAVRALERAVTLSPALLAAREALADAYAALGRHEDRLSELQALVGLEPSSTRERALGVAYAAAGHFDRAIAQLGRATQRYPNDPATFLALGRLWLNRAAEGGRVELNKALEALGAATGQGASSEALTVFGQALMMGGELGRAERVLQQAGRLSPAHPEAFLSLADVASELGHTMIANRALIDYAALVPARLLDAETAARVEAARRALTLGPKSSLGTDPGR